MQSHQDIKANPLDDFPTDMLLEIATYLRPEDAVHFFSSPAELREVLKNEPLAFNYFWQKKLELHFPDTFKQIKNTNWQAAFIEADKAHYPGLSFREKKLFSIVKEGDIESFIDGEYSFDDLRKRDIHKNSALTWAIKNQHQAMLDHFYKKLAIPYFTKNTDDSLDLDKRDEGGNSILHWAACCKRSQDAIVALITAGINIDVASSDGATPLFVAAQNGHLNVVKTLIAQGADVNAKSSDDFTPLHVASLNGHLGVVKELLTQGADVNAASSDGVTPLHVTALNGHLGVVKELLTQGADVNAASSDGVTPLYLAVYFGHLNVVKELLEQGADVNTANSNGATPLDIATKNGHQEVANVLAIAMLQNYIKARSAATAPEYKSSINVFGLFTIHAGSSKNEKVSAATMLKCVLQGADPVNLKEHEKALNHGDLGKIFSVVKNDVERRKKDASSGFRI